MHNLYQEFKCLTHGDKALHFLSGISVVIFYLEEGKDGSPSQVHNRISNG